MMVMMVMVTTRKCNGDCNDVEVVTTKRNGIDDDDGDGDDDDGDDDEYDDLWRSPFRDHRGAPGGVGTP